MAEVVEYGSVYLLIVVLSVPAVRVNFIAARSIQGTGDTRMPMYVNGAVNPLDIVATICLAFGFYRYPNSGWSASPRRPPSQTLSAR